VVVAGGRAPQAASASGKARAKRMRGVFTPRSLDAGYVQNNYSAAAGDDRRPPEATVCTVPEISPPHSISTWP
jgi:hypothetical protein